MKFLKLASNKKSLRVVSLAMAIVLVIGSVSLNAEARRRRHHSKKNKKAPVTNEKVLYDRIGGSKVMGEIVDEWMRLNLADPRIAPYFSKTIAKPDRLQKVRKNLNDQICELADGPCQYKGADLKKMHEGMHLGEDQFVPFAENLFRSMQKAGVAEREKNELLGRLGILRAEMMGELPPESEQ
jgi:hemoglobin